MNEKDKSSWTEENFAKNNIATTYTTDGPSASSAVTASKTVAKNLKSGASLSPSLEQQRGYSSLIVQHDKETTEELLNPKSSSCLPMIHLPIRSQDETQDGKSAITTNEEK